jgi:hypothetical protein
MAYSRDGFPLSLDPSEKSFHSAPLNTGVPILDQDINLMQRIQQDRDEKTFNTAYRCGWFKLGSILNFGLNNFEMEHSEVFCDGAVATVRDTQIPTSNRIEVETTVGRPAGQTFDIAFLEVWHEEVRETDVIYQWGNVLHLDPAAIPNDIIDPEVGISAAVRLQRRYRIRVVAEASTMTETNVTIQGKHTIPEPPPLPIAEFLFDSELGFYFNDTTIFTSVTDYDDLNGIVKAFPIALIERTVGDDDLNNAIITDLRWLVQNRITSFAAPQGSGTLCNGYEFNGQVYSPEVIDTVISDSLGNNVTIDFCDGNVHFVDLAPATGDVTVTLDNPLDGGVYYITFKQHPTTPVQLIWPVDVDFVLGNPFSLSGIGGDIDVIQLIRTSNPSYRLFPMGPGLFNVAKCQQDLNAITDPIIIDWSICDSWRVFLDESLPLAPDVTLLNAQAGGVYSIKFVQPSTGTAKNFNFTDPLHILGQPGYQLRPSNQNDGIDIYTLYFDGTQYCFSLEGDYTQEISHYANFGSFPAPFTGVGTFASDDSIDPEPLYFSSRNAGGSVIWRRVSMQDDSGSFGAHVLDDHTNVSAGSPPEDQPGFGRFLEFVGGQWVASGRVAIENAFNFGVYGAGAGAHVFKEKSPSVPENLDFRGLTAGSNITITEGTTDIVIAATVPASGGAVDNGANVGSGDGQILQNPGGSPTTLNFKRLLEGPGIDISDGANDVTISRSSGASGFFWAGSAGTVGPLGFGETTLVTVPTSVISGTLIRLEGLVHTSHGSSSDYRIRLYEGATLLREFLHIYGDNEIRTEVSETLRFPPGNNLTYTLRINRVAATLTIVYSQLTVTQLPI